MQKFLTLRMLVGCRASAEYLQFAYIHLLSEKDCECARLFERHIACPIVARRKSSDSQNYINAIAIIERIETMTAKHIGALESAWASLLGDSDTGRRPDLGGSTFGDTEKREVELGKNEP